MHHRGPYNMNQDNRGRMLRAWLILIGVILAVALVIVGINSFGGRVKASADLLPCLAGQKVTPFGEYVLYYDGASIHCVTDTGAVRWSFHIGSQADFAVGERTLVAWYDDQLYIVDYNGRTTYKDSLPDTIQFVRVGKKYAAAVIGPETKPTLLVKDLQGTQVDEETEAFAGMVMLDVGFYGDQGQYLWTTVLDVYGTAANTILNTFEVGRMNTGVTSLGEAITYEILYENAKLRVISTRQMRTFNYQGIENTAETMLVYGWRLLDYEIPRNGDALMLFAPTAQTNSTYAISEMRLLYGETDRRFTLPSVCAGGTVYNNALYAFSSEYIYRARLGDQRFTASDMPIAGKEVTDYLGRMDNGKVLLACGNEVYVVTLPT
ncbi:MAG: hypothetical protein IJF65_00780 [Clostridia bacterium]|nr:hypothetical protein [Clostridia bacterium]